MGRAWWSAGAGAAAVTLGLAVGGCAEREPKAAGEPCVASSECGPGLVCDLIAVPPVCSGHVTTDAAVIDAGPIDAARPDAAIDAAVDAAVDAAIDAPAAQAP